jgi:glycosyltransferase involved in cell wall biosynthesis
LLVEAGWTLDVFDFDTALRPEASIYQLVIGFGDAYEHICLRVTPRQIRVFYATGAYLPFQNAAETARVADVLIRHGVRLAPRRHLDRSWPASHYHSQRIFLIGNEWTRSTYPTYGAPITLLSPTTNARWLGPRESPPNKRRGFLWLGSSGQLHKGLDLVIDAARLLPDAIEIHICGDNLRAEPDFWALFGNLPPNIHRHGFVDLGSKKFLGIVESCSFVILPSCSEGMATSVLAGMASGLIPVVTRQCGVDVDGCGMLIEELTPESVSQAMANCLRQKDDVLVKLGLHAHRRVAELHTTSTFQRQLSAALAELGAIPPS